jgi:type IV pilus assembly protein PilQ
MRARSAMLPVMAAGLLLAATAAPRATSSSVQLLEVKTRQQAGRVAVVLEASAPMAYTSSQPDPFTVVVDLRHVSTSATVNRLARAGTGPVSGVRVEQATAADGAAVARVLVGLAEPARAAVQSARNEIAIEFPDVPPAASGTTEPAAGPAPAPAASPGTGVATELVSVISERVEGRARVRLRGNGALSPTSIEEARDLPPRLVIDLPGVLPKVPAVLPVGGTDLKRIRVAANSQTPLVTRVVLDLTRRLPYRVDGDGGREIVIELGDAPAAAAATGDGPADATAPTPTLAAADAPAAPAPPPAAPAVDPAPAPAVRAPLAAPAVTGTTGTAIEQAGPRAAPGTAASSPPLAPATARLGPAPPARAAGPAAAASQATPPPPPADVKAASPGATAALQASAGDAPRQFTGHPVSLDFEGVDLRAVLRTFAEITGLNIVIDPAVQGTVDVALRDVPWDQALDIILRANQLGYAVDGTIVRIAPLKVLADEEAAKRKLAEERALSGELQVLTKVLNYSKATSVEPLLKNVLSSRGKTAFDARTNTLIVYDLPEYLQRVTSLVDALDQPELQVEIEARIIQTESTFARELGVKWGFYGAVAPELGNTTGLAFPNSGSLFGATGAATGVGGVNPAPAAVNLGTVGTPTSAVGLTLGSINGSFRLAAELSALESAGRIKTLLTPRIVTQNNVKATITRGQEIPYSTITSTSSTGGSLLVPTVQFRTAALVLEVTPHITGANTVVLEVDVDNGTAGQVQLNGNRAINTQRAQTTVLVADGATTVIGGIQSSQETDDKNSVPGLSRIPLLGKLFQYNARDEFNQEILVFITPRIVRMPAAAPAAPAAPAPLQ